MSKEFKDSIWDSAPVYIVFALANIWFLIDWIFNLTMFGHSANAAAWPWHVFAILLSFAFWRYTYLLVVDKIDGSKGLAQAIWFVLFLLIPFMQCGFTFSFA